MLTPWIAAHRLLLGLLADTLTFLGAALLTRDSFQRLAEVNRRRTIDKIHGLYPALNFADDEWAAAVQSTRWAFAGFFLVSLGFLCQLLLRAAEWFHD